MIIILNIRCNSASDRYSNVGRHGYVMLVKLPSETDKHWITVSLCWQDKKSVPAKQKKQGQISTHTLQG